MINPFILDYKERLRHWAEFRDSLKNSSLEEQCVKVDQFWQQSPMIDYYLHPDEIEKWPDPWLLLNDNAYCYYARALGIVYTLLLLGKKDIEIVEATDYNSNDVVLVVDNYAKYVMNYWPDSVLNSTLTDFRIKRRLDISPLLKKINI